MAAVLDNSLKSDVAQVCRQFNEELPTLEKCLTIRYNSTKAPDFAGYPTLSHIPREDILKKVEDIQLAEVMVLYDILNTRFQ